MKNHFWLTAVLVGAALILAGCPDPNNTPDPVNAAAPLIKTQPKGASYTLGASATALTVSAEADDGGILSYQWFSNSMADTDSGTPLEDAVSLSYKPSTAKSGTVYYYVVVTNTNSSATGKKTAKTVSDYATVIVNDPDNAELPVITRQPVSAAYLKGAEAVLLSVTATVSEGGSLSYQWFINTDASNVGGTSIEDAVDDSYAPSTAEAGVFYYYVEVTNTDNSVTGNKTAKTVSAYAAITVNNPAGAALPVITQQPAGAIYLQSEQAAALTVTASVSDGGVLSYQWYKAAGANATSGGTSVGAGASFVPPTAAIGVFYYYVEVINTNASATGEKTAKTVSAPVTITVNVQSTNIKNGETFLIYGYDVISSSYINRDDVKVGAPILDINRANNQALFVQATATASKWESVTTSSVKELYEKISGGASVEGETPVFSAKVESEFSVSSNSKKTNFFSKGLGIHYTKDEWLKSTDPATLSGILTDAFKSDISSLSAAQIITKYGTHLIARCYWGGTAEFNYSYSGTELTDASSVSVAVEASYGAVSGSANVAHEAERKELNDNSTFKARTVGGKNTSITGVEDFKAKYEDWVTSIQAQPDICAIGNFGESLIPLWTLIAQVNAGKATAVQNEFNNQANTRGIALAGFIYRAPLVYDVQVLFGANPTKPNNNSAYKFVQENQMYYTTSEGFPMNGNRFAGDDDIWVVYLPELRTNNHEAIAEIKILDAGTSAPPAGGPTPPIGWTLLSVDLNKASPGHYLYLIYRKVNSGDTQAIDYIGNYTSMNNVTPSTDINQADYSWVTYSSRNDRGDLNLGAGGAYVFLTVRKTPFVWSVV
jgi:hypothetical protein